MEEPNEWKLLLAGQKERALSLLRDDYSRLSQPGRRPGPDAGEITRLSLAYLWLGDYVAAWDFLQEAIPKQRWSVDAFFVLAGVAKWCLDDPLEAVRTWKKGLKTNYGDDVDGSIGVPILLLATLHLRPELCELRPCKQIFSEAKKVLLRRLEKKLVWVLLDERAGGRLDQYTVENQRLASQEARGLLARGEAGIIATSWPASLGCYMLGLFHVGELRAACERSAIHKVSALRDREISRHHWYSDFYEGVMELSCGNKARFAELMQRMVDKVEQNTTDPEIFPSYLKTEEFFIARHELRLLRGESDPPASKRHPSPREAGP